MILYKINHYWYGCKLHGIALSIDVISAYVVEIIFDSVLDISELQHISNCTQNAIDIVAFQMPRKTETIHLQLINAVHAQKKPSFDEDDKGYLVTCTFASESPQNKIIYLFYFKISFNTMSLTVDELDHKF